MVGNKIYRDYVNSLYVKRDDQNEIYQEIIDSLQFILLYIKENEIKFSEYFLLDFNIIPVALKHIYSRYNKLIFLCMLPATCFKQLVQLS